MTMAKDIALFGLIPALLDVASETELGLAKTDYVTLCPFLSLKPIFFLSDLRRMQCLLFFSLYLKIDLIK